MIINYPGKYTDLKRFFIQKLLKIIHNFHQEINIGKMSVSPAVWLSFCHAKEGSILHIQSSIPGYLFTLAFRPLLKTISKSQHKEEPL